MTDNNHPITPPPELVRQWWDGTHGAFYEFEAVATQAARWGADQQLKLDIEQVNQAWQKGADQELEACCEWLTTTAMARPWGTVAELALELRSARRPKPLTLKEQALEQLKCVDSDLRQHGIINTDFIRRALESLPS